MIAVWVSIAWAVPRPAAVGFVDSAEGNVRCQYETADDCPRCEQVVGWAERAWAVQVDAIGFNAPLPDAGVGGSDALDIYLTRTAGGAGQAWVDCENGDPGCIDADPTDGLAATPSYIVIDPRTSDADFPLFVYHEFQHTTQYATDYAEPFLSVWEGTAVACEHWTEPTWATIPHDFGDYQATPWLSAVLQDGYIYYDLTGVDSWYEYGAVAWVLFLDDRFGDGSGSIGPILWADLAQEGDGLEPDALDAWDAISGDWQASFLDFTADRARMGTDAGPAYAAFAGDYGFAPREGSLTDGTATPANPPYPLGASFYDVPIAAGAAIDVALDGDPTTRWAVLAIEDGSSTVVDGGPYTAIGDHGVTLAVVNLGPDGMDADNLLEPASFQLTVTAATEPRGCGCASASPAPWPAALALVALRRRRAKVPPSTNRRGPC